MSDKPTTAAGYPPDSAELAYATSLYIATKLGDLLHDIVLIGGLMPSLIIPQRTLSNPGHRHVGTMDVDLGLSVAVLNERRYQEICRRLKNAEFRPHVNEQGNATSQRWCIDVDDLPVTVDFLIPATSPDDRGGRLKNLEEGFAAIIAPGLELAFLDRQSVTLRGRTIRGEQAERDVGVCGAGAFVILKALALDARGENKDAYDLSYVIQHFGSDVADVADRMAPLLSHEMARRAIDILARDFADVDAIGPRRLAAFLGDPGNDAVRADAAGGVRSLLNKLKHA